MKTWEGNGTTISGFRCLEAVFSLTDLRITSTLLHIVLFCDVLTIWWRHSGSLNSGDYFFCLFFYFIFPTVWTPILLEVLFALHAKHYYSDLLSAPALLPYTLWSVPPWVMRPFVSTLHSFFADFIFIFFTTTALCMTLLSQASPALVLLSPIENETSCTHALGLPSKRRNIALQIYFLQVTIMIAVVN